MKHFLMGLCLVGIFTSCSSEQATEKTPEAVQEAQPVSASPEHSIDQRITALTNALSSTCQVIEQNKGCYLDETAFNWSQKICFHPKEVANEMLEISIYQYADSTSCHNALIDLQAQEDESEDHLEVYQEKEELIVLLANCAGQESYKENVRGLIQNLLLTSQKGSVHKTACKD